MPSGALSYYKNSEGKSAALDVSKLTKIEVIPNGPVLVHGEIEITHSNGAVEKESELQHYADVVCQLTTPTVMEHTSERAGKKAEQATSALLHAIHLVLFVHVGWHF